MSTIALIISRENIKTAAYGWELTISRREDTIPSINDIMVLLLTHGLALQLCNARVRIPIAVVLIIAI